MRGGLLVALITLFAGCMGGPSAIDGGKVEGGNGLSDLVAEGATIVDNGPDRTFVWDGALGRGAAIPLAGVAPQSDEVTHSVPVDGSVGTLQLRLDASSPAVAQLRTDTGELACVARSGRVCSTEVPNEAFAEWSLSITSLSPEGASYTVGVTLRPAPAAYGEDPTLGGQYDVHEAGQGGGEPTLAILEDGRVIVVAGADVLRMDTDGTFSDVTPPIDAAAPVTLDPFLVGDPVTGRVYNSQLAQCMRLSWTDDGGDTWLANPLACGGPEQHHQKLAVGNGPVPGQRALYIGMMNLASWLTTDEVVVMMSRSLDGGAGWTQNPALVRQVHGMEARAVGNVAVGEDGVVHVVAYLCDGFVDSEYRGLGVGRSTDYGATWTWQRIGAGGGRCEGIDPGIAAVGTKVHAAWWDFSSGTPAVWYAQSDDSGVSWTPPAQIPTPGLKSFAMVDAAANEGRVVATFLANPDTTVGPTQAEGWSRWFPYVASLDLATQMWSLTRLEDHPVQVGPICMDGPMCMDGARNLLDFNDIQLGKDGLARVSYTDGCNAECVMQWESREDMLRIAVERAQ